MPINTNPSQDRNNEIPKGTVQMVQFSVKCGPLAYLSVSQKIHIFFLIPTKITSPRGTLPLPTPSPRVCACSYLCVLYVICHVAPYHGAMQSVNVVQKSTLFIETPLNHQNKSPLSNPSSQSPPPFSPGRGMHADCTNQYFSTPLCAWGGG